MANPSGLFNKFKTKMFESYSEDLSKMLLYTGTLGWLFSSTAQIIAIAKNDKTSKKEKRFMLPQEIADAAVNIISYFLVTLAIQKSTKKLVSSGKIITPKIKEVCTQYGIKLFKTEQGEKINIGKAVLDKIRAYKSTQEVAKELKINSEEITSLSAKINELEHFYDHNYAPIEGGFSVAGNIVGVILSGNIITPLLRNPIAAAKQKSSMKREQLEKDADSYRSMVALQGVTPLKMNDYKAKVANKTPLTLQSSSLRI